MINHSSNLWHVIRRSSYDAISLWTVCDWSASPQWWSSNSGWNNSSHDPCHDSLWYLCVFPVGIEKCNKTEIMMCPPAPCQGSFLSLINFRPSLFWEFEWPVRTPFRQTDISLFYLLYRCECPCWADRRHDCGQGLGDEQLNEFLISGVHTSQTEHVVSFLLVPVPSPTLSA